VLGFRLENITPMKANKYNHFKMKKPIRVFNNRRHLTNVIQRFSPFSIE
jgi:hypothetical protein